MIEQQIHQHFQAIIDENEDMLVNASSPQSVDALFRAIYSALAETPGPSVGLSATRKVDGDAVVWSVALSIDDAMTIIDSETDYTETAIEDIASTILNCWDTAWDE